MIEYKRVAAGGQTDAGKRPDSEKRRTSHNQSAEAQDRLQQAEATLKAAAQLYSDKNGSKERLDEAKFDVEISKAELKGDQGEAARIRLRKAEAGLEQLTKLHAEKLTSSEALEDARLNVEMQRAALNGDDLEFARLQEQLRQNIDRRSSVRSDKQDDAAASGEKGDTGAAARELLRQAEAELVRLTKLHAEKQVGALQLEEAQLIVALRAAELKDDNAEAVRVRSRLAENELKRLTEQRHRNLIIEERFQIAKEVLHAEIDPASGGKAVGGVQTRLQADKAVWKSNETPQLTLDVRNVSDAPLPIPVTQELGELEIDGISYRWPAKVRARIPTIEPGQATPVIVTLSPEWQNQPGEVLTLKPGNYIVRFALGNAWSNPVKIEILPEKADATSALLSQSAEGIDQLSSMPAYIGSNESRQRVPLSSTRDVVNEWLGHVGGERTDQMWSLTTRESGMDTGIRKLSDFESIRAKHVLGSDIAAMVVSTRFKDDSARPRALLFTLVKQNARWLIRDLLMDTPDNIQRRVEGFASYPGVKFDVRSEDIVGEWTSGFLVRARHSFKPDGTGEQDIQNGEKRARSFRWEVNGDVLRTFGDQLDPYGSPATEGRIVRMEDDFFAVRYSDGNQWDYHRVPATSPAPSETPDSKRE
jgi:hypothetical protein